MAGRCAQRRTARADASHPPPAPPQGYLIPEFQPTYWIGLRTTALKWPGFTWLDRTVPPLAAGERSGPAPGAGRHGRQRAKHTLITKYAWCASH